MINTNHPNKGLRGLTVTATRVYVASTWRNKFQQDVVRLLREDGHEVYGLKDEDGFNWSEISPEWQLWNTNAYLAALALPQAERVFSRDMNALINCDVCVHVVPCGVSASLEAGWACGAGKRVYTYLPLVKEPELMMKMVHTMTESLDEIRRLVALTNAEHLAEQIAKGR